jgi:transcription termination factor Rho
VDLAAMATRAAEVAGDGEPLFLDEVARLTLGETAAAVRSRGIVLEDNPAKPQLVERLFKWAAANRRPLIDRGYLDLSTEGHGFVVHAASNYRLLPDSTYVPAGFITKFGLRRGLEIEVQAQPPEEGDRCPAALVVRSVMGGDPAEAAKVVPFEELVPYYPTKRIFLEVPSTEVPSKVDVSMRSVDILTPIGFGQRGLIVAPPRTGKTILLQGLANSVATNHPEAKLIVLLVDERPEEVTDFRRHTRGEVVSSTFDESPESHVHAAEMVSAKAKRLVERGAHVVILLDSITRLARAYNALASNSGKIMSGGLEATALQKPKRFFGAARNIEGGGSLTVMGTALIDTNSRMDDIIFEEFKGTGNMELHLDRDLVNKRIFPAINFERSGTRKEELLYHPDELLKIYGLRRIMLGVPAHEAMEMLIQRLKKTRSNAEFLLSLTR